MIVVKPTHDHKFIYRILTRLVHSRDQQNISFIDKASSIYYSKQTHRITYRPVNCRVIDIHDKRKQKKILIKMVCFSSLVLIDWIPLMFLCTFCMRKWFESVRKSLIRITFELRTFALSIIYTLFQGFNIQISIDLCLLVLI